MFAEEVRLNTTGRTMAVHPVDLSDLSTLTSWLSRPRRSGGSARVAAAAGQFDAISWPEMRTNVIAPGPAPCKRCANILGITRHHRKAPEGMKVRLPLDWAEGDGTRSHPAT
jgi:hypothetical protein